jgi:hypothetical protein
MSDFFSFLTFAALPGLFGRELTWKSVKARALIQINQDPWTLVIRQQAEQPGCGFHVLRHEDRQLLHD